MLCSTLLYVPSCNTNKVLRNSLPLFLLFLTKGTSRLKLIMVVPNLLFCALFCLLSLHLQPASIYVSSFLLFSINEIRTLSIFQPKFFGICGCEVLFQCCLGFIPFCFPYLTCITEPLVVEISST